MGPNADQPRSPEAKPGSKPDVKDDLKSPPEAKAEPEPEVKAEPPSDLTPQIAKRAYELYEQRGRRDGQAGQDRLEAEREIRDESPK
jgi:H+-transporting ATPase